MPPFAIKEIFLKVLTLKINVMNIDDLAEDEGRIYLIDMKMCVKNDASLFNSH